MPRRETTLLDKLSPDGAVFWERDGPRGNAIRGLMLRQTLPKSALQSATAPGEQTENGQREGAIGQEREFVRFVSRNKIKIK